MIPAACIGPLPRRVPAGIWARWRWPRRGVATWPGRCRCGGVAVRRGARPLKIAVDDMPVAFAIDRTDQWVASRGIFSSVFTTTRSTISSVILRGTPGRNSSSSPSRRLARKRARHLHTVWDEVPSSRATSWLVTAIRAAEHDPGAQGKDCAVRPRRLHRSSTARSCRPHRRRPPAQGEPRSVGGDAGEHRLLPIATSQSPDPPILGGALAPGHTISRPGFSAPSSRSYGCAHFCARRRATIWRTWLPIRSP